MNIRAEFRQGQPDPAIEGPTILTAVDPAEAQELVDLIEPGDRVLEIGSAFGFSSILMGCAGARVITVDPHAGMNPDSLAVLYGHIRAYQVSDRVFPLVGYSQQVMPMFRDLRAQFDLVFVDGDHDEATAEHDALAGWAMLKPRGWLVCHDYGQAAEPGPKLALDRHFPDGARVVRTMWLKQAVP